MIFFWCVLISGQHSKGVGGWDGGEGGGPSKPLSSGKATKSSQKVPIPHHKAIRDI